MQTGLVYEVIWLKGSRTPPWQCGLPRRGSVRESSAPWVEKCCSSLFCPIQLDVDFEQLDILSNLKNLLKPSRLRGLGLEWWHACPNFICSCTVEKPHCPCTENAYSVSVVVSFPVPGGPLCPLFFYLSKSCVSCLFKKTAGLSETWLLVGFLLHSCVFYPLTPSFYLLGDHCYLSKLSELTAYCFSQSCSGFCAFTVTLV